MIRATFVSDLHHFASRVQPQRYEQQIASAARQSQVMILGGDIFDFRWSQHGSIDASIDAATQWLASMGEQAPQCQWHYVLGNHDYHHHFISRLEQMALQWDGFSVHRFYVKLGDAIFLHGDVVDGHVTQDKLADHRNAWHDHETKSPIASSMYQMATAMRLHVPVVWGVRTRRMMAQRIVRYLDDIGLASDSGVRRVYFGHTHRAIDGYHFEGLTFFNGGAPLPGLDFQLLPLELTSCDATGH